MEQDGTKNITFFRFEDLRVYHKSLDYYNWVINATSDFPDNKVNFVANQLLRSSQNISFFIVEGSARNKSQFIHFLKMAKSSVRECVVITSIAEKQNYFNETLVDESRNELMELTKMLGALIGSLQKSNNKMKPRDNGRDSDTDNKHDYDLGVTSDFPEIANTNY